jgi:sterol desaturase/sphingolipid hydroxylase (fatty acid hydroxylase superfamily)
LTALVVDRLRVALPGAFGLVKIDGLLDGAWKTMAFFFVYDFFYYWFHRAQHTFGWLWRIHRMHHAINPLHLWSGYHHILEEVLRLPVIALPLALLWKIDVPDILFLTAFTNVWGAYLHSDTSISMGPLQPWFCDSPTHRLHHSRLPEHYNRNFATFFPLWDRLGGTYMRPPAVPPPVGLDDRAPARGVVGALLDPWR